MRAGVNLTARTACSFACQALAVITGQAKAGWQARVSLGPRRATMDSEKNPAKVLFTESKRLGAFVHFWRRRCGPPNS